MMPLDTAPADGRWVVLLERKQPDSRAVLVEERRYPEGTALEVVRYEDQIPSLGKFWSSAALSPDGERLLFLARDGRHVRHLATGSDDHLIQRSPYPSARADAPEPDVWQWHHEVIAARLIADPAWSADGRYVSLSLLSHEGGNKGILRLVDGAGWKLGDFGARAVRWAPRGARLAVADAPWFSLWSWLGVHDEPSFQQQVLFGPLPPASD